MEQIITSLAKRCRGADLLNYPLDIWIFVTAKYSILRLLLLKQFYSYDK